METMSLRNEIEKILQTGWSEPGYDMGVFPTRDGAVDQILSLLEGIEHENINLRADLAGAMGHMRGCGHPWKYLEKRYPELTRDTE